ncbi:MAG: DUF2794 domain-containing protein [Proteobacteria bacterium]|jgi:hypothetical protein|nr:DUF2794 domain-containing protein [Pseudomonadota bacterium]
MATLLDLSIGQNRKSGRNRTFFNRQELRQLLEVYSRRVATGEWRDYAIDDQGNTAVFSVFRHSYDAPLFSVAKSSSGKDSTFTVFHGKQKLKQHQSLDKVLKVFDSPLRLIATR